MYKLIKSVIRTVMSSVWLNYQYFFQRKQVTLSKTKRNLILFGIPNHPNLGDQAIVIAEQKFIKLSECKSDYDCRDRYGEFFTIC